MFDSNLRFFTQRMSTLYVINECKFGELASQKIRCNCINLDKESLESIIDNCYPCDYCYNDNLCLAFIIFSVHKPNQNPCSCGDCQKIGGHLSLTCLGCMEDTTWHIESVVLAMLYIDRSRYTNPHLTVHSSTSDGHNSRQFQIFFEHDELKRMIVTKRRTIENCCDGQIKKNHQQTLEMWERSIPPYNLTYNQHNIIWQLRTNDLVVKIIQ